MNEQANDYKIKNQEYYKNVRNEILPLLPPYVDRIFEVGCGGGYTLSFLKEKGRCTWAGGVELFHEAAAAAKAKDIDLIVEGNIGELELPLEFNSLDVILCLDVLEHLIDPRAVLQNLYKYLKPQGFLICSIPNVRNFRVVLPLVLKGEWSYSKDGILDQTHLRFFTKKSAISLVASSGLRVDMVRSTGVEKWNKVALANLLTLNLFKSFFEFQYLIRGIKQ